MAAHAMLSASSSERWLHCPPSAMLAVQYPRTTSEYAEAGTLAHAIAELKARKHFLEPMGSRSFSARMRKFKADPHYDPGMEAATSEKGLLVLDGEAHGVGGHAARGDGKNALYIALDDIAALRAHGFARVSPISGKVMLNVTQIQAGSAHNIIPGSCSFVADIRPTEQYTNQEILEELQAICRSELKARNLRNRSSATRHFPRFLANEHSRFVLSAIRVTAEISPSFRNVSPKLSP